MLRPFHRITTFVIACAAFGGAYSADITWSGGASGVWSGANWGGATWTAGSRAVFNSDAQVNVDAATGNVAGFAFNGDVTLAGSGQITLSANGVSVDAGKTAVISAPLAGTAGLNKTGDGTLRVNNPVFSGRVVAGGGTLIIAEPANQTLSLDLNNGNATVNDIVFEGPGRIDLSKRVYPNNVNKSFTFDNGLTFSLTTHNGATDGLFVSGNRNCLVNLGNCTVINAKAGSPVCLARCVTLNLTDTEVGTTISTRNTSNTTITMQTNPSQAATMSGAGKLNLVGGGTFSFDANTAFNNTGLVTVDDNTTAIINANVPNLPFLVKNGGVLQCNGKYPAQHVTVEATGTFDLGPGSGTKTMANGIEFKAGSILQFTVATTMAVLDGRDSTSWHQGKGTYFPSTGKVTISPVAGTDFGPGTYTLITDIRHVSMSNLALSSATLAGYNLALVRDGTALKLQVSSDPLPGWSVWTGAAGADWSGLSWDNGAAFPAGAGALFQTANASATLDAAATVRELDFEASATVTGASTLTLTHGDVYVADGARVVLDVPVVSGDESIRKYGPGTLAINAAKSSPMTSPFNYAGRLELFAGENESAVVNIAIDDYRRTGGISYIGPGSFTSTRFYPRNAGSTNIVDGGATVTFTASNARDGLMVSGGLDGTSLAQWGHVALGDCTIRSGYEVETILCRAVNVVLTDTVNGATFFTESPVGTPIRLSTSGSGNLTSLSGAGRLNIAGSGQFLFHNSMTYSNTGLVTVRNGATAQSWINLPTVPFFIEAGGILNPDRATAVKSVEFAAGGIYCPTLASGTATYLTANDGVTWPAEGKAIVRVAGPANLANGTYTILVNAGADALSHVTLENSIPGKAVTLKVEGGALKAVIATGEFLELTWKGGNGAWSDADGWNGDAWVDSSLATIPAAGGTISLSDSITLSSLNVLGETSITGNGAISYMATNNVINIAADTTIAPTFSIPSKGLLKYGAGALELTGPAQADGLTLGLYDGGSLDWTQPASGVAKVNFSASTALGLGGGSIAYNNLNFSAGTNILRNAQIVMAGNTFRTERGATQTLIFDEGTSLKGNGIDSVGARFWVYNGAHVILGVNCGKLEFALTAGNYVGAADPGTVNRLTILGGELAIDAGTDTFGIAARNEATTGIVHVVNGKLTANRMCMARRWVEENNFDCLGHGELTMDGGTLTVGEFNIGATKVWGADFGTGDAVLRFNGGTAVIGQLKLYPFIDRDILFNGTVFKPSTNDAPFMTQETCKQYERLEIGVGGLIIDTDGHNVGFDLAPTGTGDFTKRGAGTLTMMRDLPATGAVAVEAGTLTADANRAFAGGGSVADGATLAAGVNTLTFAGNVAVEAGATLSFALTSGASGAIRAPAIAAAGTFNVALSVDENWHGTAVLVENLSGVTLADITVTGLPQGASARLADGRLYVVGADVNAWKGGVGNWNDSDGWNESSWVDGSPALFITPTGSTVTLGSSVNVAQFGFLESASLLGSAGITLADGQIDVPGDRVVEIAPTLTVNGLVKTGAGALSLGGTQNSLGSLNVAAGTFEAAGTIGNLSTLTVADDALLRFANGATMTVTGAAELPANSLAVGPGATASLAVGSFDMPQNFLVPAGLTVTAATIPYVTVTNGVTAFTVDGTLVDQDQLMIGWVGNGSGSVVSGQIYNIAGSGTLRVKELCSRTTSWPTFTISRVEATGGRLYAPSFATYRLDGTTIGAYGADIVQGTSPDVASMMLLAGGVTFDTLDAEDGTTARTITLADSKLSIDGEGPLVKTGPGTLVLDVAQTYTGATRVEGGTLEQHRPSATSGYMVTGTGSTLALVGEFNSLPSTAIGAGAKLVFGNGAVATQAKPGALTLVDGSAIEIVVGTAGGVPVVNLVASTLTSTAPIPVQVRIASALPNGYYELLLLPPNDDATYARFAITVVNNAGGTAEIVRDAASGVVRLLVGGSSVMPTENVWKGRGASGNWSEGVNWSSSDSPLEHLAIVFGGASGLTNANNTASSDFGAARFEADAGAFDIDLHGAVVNYVTNLVPCGAVMTLRNLHTSADYKQYGTGTTRLVDPVFSNTVEQPDGLNTANTEDNTLIVEVSEGKTVNFTGWNNSWNGGKRVFTGKGTVVMNRIYPYRLNCPVVFDGGITAWANTHVSQADGMCVSGLVDAHVDFGDCTFGTRFESGVVTLCRYLTFNFTDLEKGTTFTTDNIDGNPVTIQTGGGYQGNITFAGAGRINIGGHGSFVFHHDATFNNTGMITVNSGATAVVNAAVAITNAPFTVAGKLQLAAGAVLGTPVNVSASGCLELLDAAATSGAVLAGGATVKLPVNENWQVTKFEGPLTPPASGKAAIMLAGSTLPVLDTSYTLTHGAGLHEGDEGKFTVPLEIGGTLCMKAYARKFAIVDGELAVTFKKANTVLFIR